MEVQVPARLAILANKQAIATAGGSIKEISLVHQPSSLARAWGVRRKGQCQPGAWQCQPQPYMAALRV